MDVTKEHRQMDGHKRSIGRWLGVLAAVLVPAIATAALTIPNTFTAGTVIKSADVNANFAAVATEVNNTETSLASLQSTVSSLQTTVTNLQTTVTNLQNSVTSVSKTVASAPQMVGYAKVYYGSVLAFGGTGTTNVTVSGSFPNIITFTGSFPSTITANKVQIMATPWAYDYNGLDAEVVSATTTSIVVYIYEWETDNLLTLNSGYSLVLVDQP
jgi:hypothetical protein